MAIPADHPVNKYSYADYLGWGDDQQWELIDGSAYCMSPSPTTDQQEVLGAFHYYFFGFFLDKPCRVFCAPFDVRLSENYHSTDDIHTVVQPDLAVICDNDKIDKRGCKGAPDFILEILSPSTAGRDMKVKRALYERFGVKEYWAVDPVNEFVQVFTLQDGKYGISRVYSVEDTIEAGLFPELKIPLTKIFGIKQPGGEYEQ